MHTSRRHSAYFAAAVCLIGVAALLCRVDANPKIPNSIASVSVPSLAVIASEQLELDMSRVEAEAMLRRFGFRGGIYNLNCGSADGIYSLPGPDRETIMLSYGIADEKGMRHLKQWRVCSGRGSIDEPRMFSDLHAFKLVNVSTPDQWPSSSTIHSVRGCFAPIETQRTVIVPLLTTPEDLDSPSLHSTMIDRSRARLHEVQSQSIAP